MQAVIDARQHYGRLLALLASRSWDVAGAEDALAEAFESALELWPKQGVPTKPEAWLFTVARNRQLDQWRSAAAQTSVPLVEEEIEDMFVTEYDRESIPDERLKLMFVCAHPAIDPALRAPLMLQTVLGIEAEAIAAAYLVPTATMAQRLVRVKKKIKEAAIPFDKPSQSDMPSRIEAVLEAVYGAYSIGWSGLGVAGTDLNTTEPRLGADDDLAEESRYLANLLAQLMPEEPEVLGLASYVSFANARRAARMGTDGEFVPLDEQDCALWDRQAISWGERLLARARELGGLGRFQLEAAIQSVHCHRAHTGATDWYALALLYEGLLRFAPSLGAAVARAIAVGRSQSAQAGLAALNEIESKAVVGFQPAWVARAYLLELDQAFTLCVKALDQAILLTTDSRSKNFLKRKMITVLLRAKTHSS
jgi:predicted RNA polymerase sigma factor